MHAGDKKIKLKIKKKSLKDKNTALAFVKDSSHWRFLAVWISEEWKFTELGLGFSFKELRPHGKLWTPSGRPLPAPPFWNSECQSERCKDSTTNFSRGRQIGTKSPGRKLELLRYEG